MSRCRLLGDGSADNWVLIDENGEIVEGVVSVEVKVERGKEPRATVVLDGLEMDVRAEIRRLTGEAR